MCPSPPTKGEEWGYTLACVYYVPGVFAENKPEVLSGQSTKNRLKLRTLRIILVSPISPPPVRLRGIIQAGYLMDPSHCPLSADYITVRILILITFSFATLIFITIY
jgi:hypothetical protein